MVGIKLNYVNIQSNNTIAPKLDTNTMQEIKLYIQ